MKYFLLFFLISYAEARDICRYSFTVWNNNSRTSEGPFTIIKNRDQLSAEEKGIDGCSVCEDDQTEIKLSNGIKFTACKKLAGKFSSVIEKYLQTGGKVTSVIGYRPSKSKGNLDSSGRRTQFSRHAFGVAVDINEEFNGLYDQCIEWNPSCRLIKGGKYSVTNPLSFTRDSALVRSMKDNGLLWGGEIRGFQKDFMHFSPDGL